MPDALLDELTELLGSRREARWLLEELDGAAEGRREAAVDLASRRRAGEPLQYVLGHWPFRRLDLLVDPAVLIPRPETEELVEVALPLLETAPTPVACDLGCGSGAIALSLATESRRDGREVHATDVSAAALDLARRNAVRVGADGVTFHLGDWFGALPGSLRGALGLVCANPPYVAVAERHGLQRELDHEPDLALVADDGDDGTEGFAAVERVIRGAAAWLAPGGALVVEHGERHGDAAVRCAAAAGLVDVADHRDLAGHPRVLVARRRG